MIHPFNKKPEKKTAILIVGSEGVGKHALALDMLKTEHPFELNIRTAGCLPLPAEKAADRPRLDFICFVIDITKPDSFKIVKESLQHMDISYCLGKACLVVSKVKNSHRSTPLESIHDLANRLSLQVVFGDLEDETERLHVARRLVSTLHLSAGLQCSGSAPTLVNCVIDFAVQTDIHTAE
ncbi:hypothetical protein ACJMK2_011578 [Sinanodonta woodiana]|uniref:Centromere protein M n=1 Tax=Sinanodonta woodiana TaxID=1069815 RepID=A0ABD3V8M4_SINWO